MLRRAARSSGSGDTKRSISSTAFDSERRIRAAASRHCAGCSQQGEHRRPTIRLRVVSLPATSSVRQNMPSSASVSRSPSSSASASFESTSSRGSRRRSADLGEHVGEELDHGARASRARARRRPPRSSRRTSAGSRRSRELGTPSSSAITNIGSGIATCSTKSNGSPGRIAATLSRASSRTRGSSAAIHARRERADHELAVAVVRGRIHPDDGRRGLLHAEPLPREPQRDLEELRAVRRGERARLARDLAAPRRDASRTRTSRLRTSAAGPRRAAGGSWRADRRDRNRPGRGRSRPRGASWALAARFPLIFTSVNLK